MRPAIFVLLTLALASPTLANIVNGSDSAVSAGVHLGAAILISWLAVGVVGHMVDSYRAASFRRAQQQHPRHHQASQPQ
jgi:hypothetical protein